MERRLYIILIALSLAFNGAMPSMAMISDGHSQMASPGIGMHGMQGGMQKKTHKGTEPTDPNGSCGNFCLDCGCLSCETRNVLYRTAPDVMVALNRFPLPHKLGHAPRLERDVAKPPPKA